MNRDPESTRTKIMNAAESTILDRGFGGTTVNAVIEQADVSKGAFFHHFSSKAELGRQLVQRYADKDTQHLEQTLVKAEGLSDDPLQQLLIFVKLFEQEIESLEEPFPGCLFASYLQQSELFDDNILDIIRESMLLWRTRVLEKLKTIEKRYSHHNDVDLESLADMLMVIFEGSFVLSQSLNENKIIAQQLAHYHNYLKLLFEEKP
ncbi:TetR/AcrR family transcriptional regulator [Fodinibius salsisoli]|uniref:TetR/AcrR family transcriptional regulator n=1 Tax=Fodinibius salsisoli TaxID=2820877 RepID=A0ABT3PJP2_9BACT|nr:TetR/AcrR family transcriptional regulator [Fodinibius salsisoli]MCW9706122.1 TetR/AcrR family transcriptional regulator [Fodinibius salsisoli]